jgi:hypothetical protein
MNYTLIYFLIYIEVLAALLLIPMVIYEKKLIQAEDLIFYHLKKAIKNIIIIKK